ncbi:MAG: polysaccharide deacetylase family protein [Sedimentisphaerales bacterium]|nr:polysaccharide deacetylase family protein [Sedimentisphaerales bacterium]
MNSSVTRGPYARHGILVRISYFLCAWISWLLIEISSLFSRKTIILCYHGIASDQAGRFQEQMIRLGKRLKKGSKFWAFPSVRITFDDAFENLLENAVPVLDRYQIPAVIFAVPGNLGRRPGWAISPEHPEASESIMTSDQLVTLSRNSLVSIGSHTLTHPDLTAISSDQVRAELLDSKRQLETLLGCPVEDLALPHGRYNDDVLTIAQDVGYKRIYTLDPRPVDFESNDTIMGRFSMSPDVWKYEFMLTCAGAYVWLSPWRWFIRRVRNLIIRSRK